MKKGLFFLAVACIAMSPAIAQMSGGLKAGLNVANIHSSDKDFDPEMLMGFHVGGFVDFAISESFSIQPELLFSSQGWKETYDDDGEKFVTKIKLGYLSLPILAKIKIGEVFNIHVGPQIGLLLSGKYADDEESEDIKDAFKKIDFGAAAGIGADLPMGLTLAARYNLGLSDIFDNSEGGNEGDLAVKNGVIQVSVGYKLFSK